MADKAKIGVEKKTLMGKIGASLAKFFNWLAKGQESNPPCTG